MPTEAYALCPVVPHLSDKGYRTPHYKIIVKEIKSETSTARESRESIDAVKNKLISGGF